MCGRHSAGYKLQWPVEGTGKTWKTDWCLFVNTLSLLLSLCNIFSVIVA